jgi:predicted Zn-dependent protease
MKEKQYLTFEKYIDQELNKEEKNAFEAKLNSDSELQKEFEIYKSLNSSLDTKFKNEESEIALRKTLNNLGAKFIKQNKAKKQKIISLFNYKSIMIAASIALLISLFIFKNGKPVYNDFSNHNALELVVRGENNSTIVKAENAFNSKNYKEALQQLTILSNAYPNDTEIKLYQGISYLELGNYTNAETIFNEISQGNSAFATTAIWYKALSYLKQKKFKECKAILKTIPKGSDKYPQAKKLLKQL